MCQAEGQLDNANFARAARLLNLLLIWNGGRAKVFENFPALIQFLFLIVVFHMSHDMTKPTKWVCAQWLLRSAWASAQSDQGLLCLHKKPWALSYPLSAQWRLWSDWADAQADLSLCWVHSHFVGFVMSWLICQKFRKIIFFSRTFSLKNSNAVKMTVFLWRRSCFFISNCYNILADCLCQTMGNINRPSEKGSNVSYPY